MVPLILVLYVARLISLVCVCVEDCLAPRELFLLLLKMIILSLIILFALKSLSSNIYKSTQAFCVQPLPLSFSSLCFHRLFPCIWGVWGVSLMQWMELSIL